MQRALIAALFLSLLVFAAPAARAQGDSSISLTLIRAVRVSETGITISFTTSVPAFGQVLYTNADKSKFTLTDSAPQTDHLFTIDQLDPKHGYSFALSASTDSADSDTYTVLLAPESIGEPGSSFMPAIQEADASGKIISTSLAASSTAAQERPIAPWWVFVLLLFLAIGGWIGYRRLKPSIHPVPPPST